MEAPSSEVAFPTRDGIVEANRLMIATFGGSFIPPCNLRNPNSLAYILEAVSRPVFDHHLFPSLKEKAAALAFEIISAHVFFDGNKRTALYVAYEFLAANGVTLVLDDTAEGIAVAVAEQAANRDSLLQWMHDHQ